MAAGPFLTYANEPDLERHLATIRGHGIRIMELPPSPTSRVGCREFRFQRRFGAVHGFTGGEQDKRWVYLGCFHPFNPLYWLPDSRLLAEIESIMVDAGSRRL